MTETFLNLATTADQNTAPLMAAYESVGKTAPRNEDAILLNLPLGIFGVFDGMGGHDHGEVAARQAASYLEAMLSTTDKQLRSTISLHDLFVEAGRDLLQFLPDRYDLNAGLNTTALLALVLPRDQDSCEVRIASVGDSRAYLWHDAEQQLECVTLDHGPRTTSIIDPQAFEQALTSQQTVANATSLQCLNNDLQRVYAVRHRTSGLLSDARFTNVYRRTLGARDKLLLCTDGIHDNLSDKFIEEVFGSDSLVPPIQLVSTLRRLAQASSVTTWRGKPDDVSLIVVGMDSVRDYDTPICSWDCVIDVLRLLRAYCSARTRVNEEMSDQASAYKPSSTFLENVANVFGVTAKTDTELKENLESLELEMHERYAAAKAWLLRQTEITLSEVGKSLELLDSELALSFQDLLGRPSQMEHHPGLLVDTPQ